MMSIINKRSLAHNITHVFYLRVVYADIRAFFYFLRLPILSIATVFLDARISFCVLIR